MVVNRPPCPGHSLALVVNGGTGTEIPTNAILLYSSQGRNLGKSRCHNHLEMAPVSAL